MMIDDIPTEEVPPRCLLIIRTPPDEAEDDVVTAFRGKIPASAAILIARRETDVFCIVEEVLNAAGWRYLP